MSTLAMTRRRADWRAAASGLAVLVLALFSTSPARANKAAEQFVQERANEVMAVINNTSYSAAKKKSEMSDILDEAVDVEGIAMYTLGKYRGATSDSELEDYIEAFHDYLVAYYVTQLSQFEGLTFNVSGSQDLGGRRGTVVIATAQAGGGEPIDINWRVRDSAIIDVQFEGVWMAQNLREQIVSTIDQHGGEISSAIETLNELSGRI